MSKGKMNWYRRAKDEYAWRHGVEDRDAKVIPTVEDDDAINGVRADVLEQCPLCPSEVLPAHMEKHIRDSHGVDMHCDPFHFFSGIGNASRQLYSLTAEELDGLFHRKPSEQILQALMIELAARTRKPAKELAADVISQYLKMKNINYYVHFDGRVFEMHSIKPPGRIHDAKSFADVMLQFKHMFRKNLRKISQTGRIEYVENVKPADSVLRDDKSSCNLTDDCSVINQMPEGTVSHLQTVLLPDFTEAGLSAFNGKSSIDGTKLTVRKTDKGTYCISLVDAHCSNVLCSSARWDAAFAICEQYTYHTIDKTSDSERLSQVTLFDSRKLVTGNKLILCVHSRVVDIELLSCDGAREVVALNATAIAANAIIDYLLSSRYEQYVKKNSVKRW